MARFGGRILFGALLVGAALVTYSLLVSGHRHPVPPAELARLARQMETRFQVDRHFILAVVENESGGDASAVSSAGAVGLMQLLPATARGLADQYHIPCDLNDPASNMALGSAYLRQLGDQFGDQPDLVIAAYHAGPGRVQSWRRDNPSLSIAEVLNRCAGPKTKAYVVNVKAAWVRNRADDEAADDTHAATPVAADFDHAN